MTTTRQEKKAAKLKAWINTPPGHIAKPLRHIANRTNLRHPNGSVEMSPAYLQAHAAATAGQGHVVASMARALR